MTRYVKLEDAINAFCARCKKCPAELRDPHECEDPGVMLFCDELENNSISAEDLTYDYSWLQIVRDKKHKKFYECVKCGARFRKKYVDRIGPFEHCPYCGSILMDLRDPCDGCKRGLCLNACSVEEEYLENLERKSIIEKLTDEREREV